MSRYIDADELLIRLEQIKKQADSLQDALFLDGIMAVVETQPTAEVQPVKFGKWVEHKDYYNHGWVCSVCGNYDHENKEGRPYFSEFCPSCGADMRNDEKVLNQL